MSSNWIVSADWHVSNKNSRFKLDKDGVSDLIRAQYDFVGDIVNRLRDDDIDGFLFLGDFTDYPTLDPITLTYVNAMVKEIVEVGKPVIFIEGNHCINDKNNNFTVVGALSKLLDQPNCHFISKNESIDFFKGTEKEISFHCFSYMSDYEKIEHDIASLNSDIKGATSPQVLLFHFPTTNAVLDNGVPSINGVNLSQEIVSNFKVCLGGDYHRAQQLVGTANAYYVGAPFDLKFGQEGFRGYSILEIEGDDFFLDQIDNDFAYPMLTISPEALADAAQGDTTRKIVRLDAPPSEDDRREWEKLRPDLYSLTIPGSKKIAKPVLNDVKVMETFDSGRDLEVIARQMRVYEVDDIVKTRATDLFQAVVSEG